VSTFNIFPNLIAVDGPDGAGKSIFTKILTAELQNIYDFKKVRLVKPSYFNTCSQAQQVGVELSEIQGKIDKDSEHHNSFFLKAMKVNYENVVLPALKKGQIVILDSSEIRALAFVFCNSESVAVKDTINRIKNGYLTCSALPKIRILLFGKVYDLQKNLFTKVNLDEGDPQNIAEIQQRIYFYQKAIKIIREQSYNSKINWVEINVQHTKNLLNEYHLNIIRTQLIPKLKFN